MAIEEIDLTQSDSDDEGGGVASRSPVPPAAASSHLITPTQYTSESSLPVDAIISSSNIHDAAGDCDGDVAEEAGRQEEEEEEEEEVLKPATTGGKGLWSLWTRNFKSTLLMLLDLVDNAVDAAMHQKQGAGGGGGSGDNDVGDFIGRVQVYRDLYEVMPGGQQAYTTGICIRNNSPGEIAPLRDVLRLFMSSKADSGSDSIGENGVGLKQSCAALSDLSFVLVKAGENKFELGVIAKALQRDDMIILPCFVFEDGHHGETIGQQMLATFTKPQYKEVGDCVAEYGRVRSGGNPSLARGVARLGKHFDDLDLNFFNNHYAFEVILDKVTHHGNSEVVAGDNGKNAAVRDIINELQHEIPRRYLHIPDESFKFCIGKKELSFKYWPERLVEFTKIEIPVRSETPWYDDFGAITPDSYPLRVFLGFDRYRIADREEIGLNATKKCCSLYIYSRTSGRMIQYDPDARNILGLNAGGTEFCQALTVIIDDNEGRLPLDPTKQGIAFGNQPHGHVHEKNLYAAVSCVVKFYYQFHKNKFGGRKALLSAKIKEFCESELPDNVKTCAKSQLTDYGVIFIQTKDNRILVDRTCYEEELVGPDTAFRLLPETQNGLKAPNGKASRSKVGKPRRTQKAAKAGKSPAMKKKPSVKASKLPAKEKRPSSKTSNPPAKRKQSSSPSDKSKAKKKQCAAREVQRPPKTHGTRFSTRKSCGKPPKRYIDSDDSESSDESEDDCDSDTMNTQNVKTESAGGAAGAMNEGAIDLCLSSDGEDEGTEEDAFSNDIVSANSQSDEREVIDAAEAKTLKVQILELRSKNTNLEARVAALETDKDSLQREKGSLENEIKKLREEFKQSEYTV